MSKKKARKLNKFKFILVIFLACMIIIGGAGIGFIAGALKNMPNIDSSDIETFAMSSFIYDKDGKLVDTLHGVENRDPVKLDEISPNVIYALLSIEDQRFYNHHGVDLYRIAGAFVANLKNGYIAQGGSTLTQQLVKISMLDPKEKSLKRKIQEAVIALKVENDYTKDEIINHYLNRVYFGHGAYGIEAAASTFFNKHAKDLKPEEAAVLAGVIQNPYRHSPILHPEAAKTRRNMVLNAMAKFDGLEGKFPGLKKLSEEEVAVLKDKPIELAEKTKAPAQTYKYQSFIDNVVETAIEKLEIEDNSRKLYTSGYKIYTTLDPKVQAEMESVYSKAENFPKGKNGVLIQSAMVVLDPHTGEVRGIIGGRDQKGKRNFNRATQALRQPGSIFKPIAVYGPALEKGYGPATVLDDFPEAYKSGSGYKAFENYNHRYRGLVSMRTGIQWSINTVAVKMLQKIGVSEGFRFAQNLGISTLVSSGSRNDRGLSLALGGLTKGASPLEIAAAYGAFANEGVYVTPHSITKIEDADGNVLWENKPKKRVVMTPQTAYLMTSMLRSVVDSGTAARAKIPNHPVAGKTGTTSFLVDAWFVGYTPDLVGAVWMGYDKKERMYNVYGGATCGPIFAKVMKKAHEGLPSSNFKKPSGIVNIAIDEKSGLLPSELTPEDFIRTEIFNKKYVPKETSNSWVEATVCPESNQLLSNSCPHEGVRKIFLKREEPWSTTSLPGHLKGIAPEDAHLEVPTQVCTIHGSGDISPINLRGEAIMNDNSDIIKATKLSWNWSKANESTIYKIYRSTKRNFIPNVNNQIAVDTTITDTTYTDTSVKSGEKYYYRVVALDEETNLQSPASNQVEVPKKDQKTDKALKPPKLQHKVKVSSDGVVKVKLNWSKPHPHGKFNYFIFRSEEPGFTPSVDNQIGQANIITSTSYDDIDVEVGKTYYYRVVAQDVELNRQSPLSNQVNVSIQVKE